MGAPRTGPSRWLALCALAALLVAAPGVRSARAQADPVQRINQAYERSMAAYLDLEFDQAKAALQMALRVAQTQGVEDPSLAKVHAMLGVLIYAETRDESRVAESFRSALAYDPKLKLDPGLASPALERILESVRSQVAPAGSATAPVTPPPLVSPIPAAPLEPLVSTGAATGTAGPPSIEHQPVARAYEGVNVPIFVNVRNGQALQRIVLRYRTPGAPWGEVDLVRQTGGGASGYIPGGAVLGDWIEYYVVGLDWSGTPLAGVAAAQRPIRVAIVQARVPGIGDALPPGGGMPPGPTPAVQDRTVHLLFGFGSGAGIAKGPPLRKPDVEVEAGLAPTPFHFYGELGFFSAESFLLLVAARVQLIVEESTVFYEPLFSLRGRWMLDSVAPVRGFVGVGGGWCGFVEDCGYVQHQVNLAPVEDFTDTTREGNAHAGLETGVLFDLSPHVALELDLFLYALFGEKSSAQADVNTGLVFSF